MVDEVLVVLRAGQPGAGVLGGRWPLLASMAPRVLIVQADGTGLAALAAHPAVAVALADRRAAIGLSVTPPLSDAEQLFVDGWAARGAKSGPRPGDGQSWDAPGFEPPGSKRP